MRSFACQYFQTPNRAQHITPKSRQLFTSPYIPRQLQADNNVQLVSSKTALLSPSIDVNKQQTLRTSHIVTTPVCKVLNDPTVSSVKNEVEDMSEDEVDSFELLSETINRLQNTSNCSNKKTVVFNVAEELSIIDSEEDDRVNKSKNKHDFKSLHKSEPDLSKIFSEKTINTTPAWNNGRLASKLMKGVSMVNLKCPLFIDRKIIRKSSSIHLKRESLVNDHTPCKENSLIDDEDFEATPNKENSLSWSQEEETNIRRRSMSPITKSTQRMSKAMQVSSHCI